MKNDSQPEVPAPTAAAEERQTHRNLRRAIAFGVIMATIEMAILLYFMYC